MPTETAAHPLDNPVWSCLTGRHAHLAVGDALARRYDAAIAPIAATAGTTPAHLAALAALVEPGDSVALGGLALPRLGAEWDVTHETSMLQLVYAPRAPLPEGDFACTPLAAADVDAMLALVERTRPGPFRRRTIELGTYLGVHDDGRLLAMAGERMWVGDWREVSAVCTDPSAQGRGLAHGLVGRIVNGMLRAGQRPFLHVEAANARALALYGRLGFAPRATLRLCYAIRRG
jgi:GNAT superfamily N-acetyltransferase